MSIKKQLKSEKGMSLIEVLSAVVLLSIIFIVAASIFPQMNNMNTRTADKLDTMSDAEARVHEITRMDAGLYPLDFNVIGNLLPGMEGANKERTSDGRVVYTLSKNGHTEQLTVWEDPDQEGRMASGDLEMIPALYRVKMEVTADGGTSSSSYAYLEVNME